MRITPLLMCVIKYVIFACISNGTYLGMGTLMMLLSTIGFRLSVCDLRDATTASIACNVGCKHTTIKLCCWYSVHISVLMYAFYFHRLKMEFQERE